MNQFNSAVDVLNYLTAEDISHDELEDEIEGEFEYENEISNQESKIKINYEQQKQDLWKIAPVKVKLMSPSSCSICFEEFSLDEISLCSWNSQKNENENEGWKKSSICWCDCCGKYFCRECISSYLEFCSNESLNYSSIIKLSLSQVEEHIFVLSSKKICGVNCPSFKCFGLIPNEYLSNFTNHSNVERLCRWSTDYCDRLQKIEEERINNNKRQPKSCKICSGKDFIWRGEYLQCNKCKKIVCEKCLYFHHSRTKLSCETFKKMMEEYETITKKFNTWASSHSLVTMCPHCRVTIEKNGGCNNMYCTFCKRSFYFVKHFDPIKTRFASVLYEITPPPMIKKGRRKGARRKGLYH